MYTKEITMWTHYPRLMKRCLVLKDHKCVIPMFWSPQLGYVLFIPSSMVGKLMTQFHSDTQTLLSVPRRGKGKVGEEQRTRERTSRQMTSCWRGSTFLCVRYLSSTLIFFFFPKIWKHGLAIERLGKGFCFIMHWNYFRMVKGRLFFFFFFLNSSMYNCVEKNV